MTQQPGPLPTPGAIALVGSGEYLDVMNTTDLYLLETLGGVSNARVALLPTASGLEENGSSYFRRQSSAHYRYAAWLTRLGDHHLCLRARRGTRGMQCRGNDAQRLYNCDTTDVYGRKTRMGNVAWRGAAPGSISSF